MTHPNTEPNIWGKISCLVWLMQSPIIEEEFIWDVFNGFFPRGVN